MVDRMRSSRKPFRMKGSLLSAAAVLLNNRGITLYVLLGAIAVVQIPVAGINVPYDSNRSSPDSTDPDFSYSYVLNKDVKYRKPKYFSNTSPVSSNYNSNSSISGRLSQNITNGFTISRGSTGRGRGSTALVAASNPVTVSSSSSSTPKLTLATGSRNERFELIHQPIASYRPLSHPTYSRHYRPFEPSSNGGSSAVLNHGYNRFGFATGSSSDFHASSSSPFSTRRGDSLFSGSSSNSAYDKNRKGYDRGVDHESLYRPITLKSSASSLSSGGGLYSNSKDKYTGSRYGTANGGSSSLSSTNNNPHNNDNDYRPRPHPFEGLSSAVGGNNNNRKDLTLSQMLDMSATNGDNLDLQHKMQIQELLYSNASRLTMNEDARQMAVIPNHCWHGGRMYGCSLSVSCVLQGSKPLDLCNGGMIWACCVPREKASEASTAVGTLDNPPFSNKSYSYDLYPPTGGFDSNSNRRPYSVSGYASNNIFGTGPSGGGSGNTKHTSNQLSSSSSTAALTAPFHDHDPPGQFPYRPSFSSGDRLVTSKPGYFNRPSYNFYRPTTYKPLLSQSTLSVSLDSESYPLYPGDVVKFGGNPNGNNRPLRPYNSINFHTSSPPTPPHAPPPPLPPLPPVSPPLTTQHPYDPPLTNDIYGPIGDHDKYFDKFDHHNKFGSSYTGSNNGASSGNKISSSSPKGNQPNV